MMMITKRQTNFVTQITDITACNNISINIVLLLLFNRIVTHKNKKPVKNARPIMITPYMVKDHCHHLSQYKKYLYISTL